MLHALTCPHSVHPCPTPLHPYCTAPDSACVPGMHWPQRGGGTRRVRAHSCQPWLERQCWAQRRCCCWAAVCRACACRRTASNAGPCRSSRWRSPRAPAAHDASLLGPALCWPWPNQHGAAGCRGRATCHPQWQRCISIRAPLQAATAAQRAGRGLSSRQQRGHGCSGRSRGRGGWRSPGCCCLGHVWSAGGGSGTSSSGCHSGPHCQRRRRRRTDG